MDVNSREDVAEKEGSYTLSMQFDKDYFNATEAQLGYYTSYEWEQRADDFRSVARTLTEFSPRSALDVGCAKGFLVRALVEMGCDARGVDISEHAIAESGMKDRLELCDLNEGTLPFDSDSLDLVTCMGTLEYLDDDTAILRDFHRVLRPGGILVWQGLARSLEHHPVLINTRSPRAWRRRIETFGFAFLKGFSTRLYAEDVKFRLMHDSAHKPVSCFA